MKTTAYKSIDNAQVRDLAWILERDSDLLLSNPPFYRYKPALDMEWLHSLIQEPQPLLNHLNFSGDHTRLGIYFEDLVDFYLRHCPSSKATNVSRNQRMGSAEDRIPFGELDFVFEREDQLCHLEVAVKFYLGKEDISGINWVGPNPSDSWSQKFEHMRKHQLPLGDHLGHFLSRSTINFYWVKGRLFQPWKRYLQPPAGVSSSKTDSWIHYGKVHEWVVTTPDKWAILPRARWLGGLSANEIKVSAVYGHQLLDAIAHHRQSNDYTLMLESVPVAGRSKYMMVVRDGWPDR